MAKGMALLLKVSECSLIFISYQPKYSATRSQYGRDPGMRPRADQQAPQTGVQPP
jgi:hypothetical protein